MNINAQLDEVDNFIQCKKLILMDGEIIFYVDVSNFYKKK